MVASRRFGALAMSGNFTAQSSDLLEPSAALDHPECVTGEACAVLLPALRTQIYGEKK